MNASPLYLLHPRYQCQQDAQGRFRIGLPYSAKCLQGNQQLATLLRNLAEKGLLSLDSLRQELGADLLHILLLHCLLLRADEVSALEHGFCSLPTHSAGQALPLHDFANLQAADVVLFHTPLESGQVAGVAVAGGGRWVRTHLHNSLRTPCASQEQQDGMLIDLDFAQCLPASALRLFDAGDISYNRMQDSMRAIGQRCQALCRRIAERHAYPLILGGDHTQAYYTIAGLQERWPRLGILHFDAHPDLYAIGATADGQLNHANVFHAVRALPHVSCIWQIGVRDMYFQPLHKVSSAQQASLHTLSAWEAATQGYERMLKTLDPEIPWFISFDVDVLAQADAPQTATPVLGGLAWYPLLQLFEQLFSRLQIVGMEFVEIGEGSQSAHGPAAIAARLISRYLFHLRGAQTSPYQFFANPQQTIPHDQN
ncbi:arginase family protein [Massilia sp. W12]|uniref:arginase family protein n=1 Tax=Massilia sp. W12 TaxID=3126507 RepID=UPI0030CE2EA3